MCMQTLAGMLKLRSLVHAKKLPLNSKGNAKFIPQGLGKLWSTLFTKRFPQTAPSNLKTLDFNSEKLRNPLIRILRCQIVHNVCNREWAFIWYHMHSTVEIRILNNLLLLMLPIEINVASYILFCISKISKSTGFFNPLSPKSGQHEISPYNVNALENRVVMRIEGSVIDTSTNSPYYFYWKRIGTTNANNNFNIRVKRVEKS